VIDQEDDCHNNQKGFAKSQGARHDTTHHVFGPTVRFSGDSDESDYTVVGCLLTRTYTMPSSKRVVSGGSEGHPRWHGDLGNLLTPFRFLVARSTSDTEAESSPANPGWRCMTALVWGNPNLIRFKVKGLRSSSADQ